MPSSQEKIRSIVDNVEKVIVGKRREVELTLLTLLCQGHALIEDVPGVGKTMLARSVSRTVGCTFKRIQFTPDLLPGDITGVSVYNQRIGDFEFRAGPVMAQVILADEINRATPKTQSALLECMEEKQITVDGTTHAMPRPFMVLATQNPIEYEGTFPLPEAQLDRFLLRITLGYPTTAETLQIIDKQQFAHPIESLAEATDPQELVELQEAVKTVYMDPLIKQYIVALVEATRQHDSAYLGASPRGALGLFRASQAWALLQGRDYVLPDDVKTLAEPVLAHRIIVNPVSRMKEVTGKTIVGEILEGVTVPGIRARGRVSG